MIKYFIIFDTLKKMDKNELIGRFDEIYNTKIVPEINIYENKRIETKKEIDKIWKSSMKFVKLALISFLFAIINPKIATICFCVFCIPFAILTFKQDRIQKEFIKEVKSNLLLKILKIFGDFKIYDSELVKLNEIKKLGFFPYASTKKDDDKFAGNYQSLATFITETELSHSGGKNSSKHTDFSGLVVRVSLNKTYTGKTVLFQKTLSTENLNQVIQNCSKETDSKEMQELSEKIRNSKFYEAGLNFASSQLTKTNSNRFKPPKNLKEVKLEDEEFNKIYSVYSNDQVEARYVITTAFMERLKDIREIFNADFVHCTFEDKSVTFYISSYKNFFEICEIDKSLYDNYNMFRDVFCQLYSIFNIIHYFKLDKKTGL